MKHESVRRWLMGWSRGQMPAFGGVGASGIATFGQSGNVTVIAPGVAAGAVAPAPPPAPAPSSIPGLGSLADYGAPAPAPSAGEGGGTFGGPVGFGDPLTWSGTITWQSFLREAARGAGEILGATAGGAVGAGVGELIVPQGGGFYGAIIGGEIGKQFGKSAADRFVDDFFFNPPPPPPAIGPYRQPPPTRPPVFNPPPLTPPAGQQLTPRDLAPIISRQPCAACGGDLNVLEHQRDELRDEILTEQAQQRSQQQQRQQQELQHFRDLERQPSQTRDIPSELAQKQQLLDEINRQIQDLGGQNPPPLPPPTGGQPPLINQNPPPPVGVLPPPPPTGPGPMPPPGGGQPRVIPSQQCPAGYHQCGADIECEQYGVNPGIRVGCAPDGNPYDQRPAPLFHQGEPPPEGLPPPENAVTFCVSCSSQGEALKFLNGEPSECSVLPQ